MVELAKEDDRETLRQISLFLDRENQRPISKTLELTAEVARLRGVADPTQLELAVLPGDRPLMGSLLVHSLDRHVLILRVSQSV